MQKVNVIARWVAPSGLVISGVVALVGCGGGGSTSLVSSDFTSGTTATPKTNSTPTAKPTMKTTPTATVKPTATTRPTAKPTGTTKPTAKPTGTPKPTAKPTATPKPTAKPTATPKPTATNKPTPTATPAPSSGTATIFFAEGTVVSGQFKQDGDGQFGIYKIIKDTPSPTATPGPTETPEPTDLPATYYTGTYTLSDGENGLFYLVDSSDTEDDSDYVGGAPQIPEDKTLDGMHPVKIGTATISVRVSGSTGSGSIRFSNGYTGTCKITSRQTFSLRSIHSLGAFTRRFQH